MARTVEELTNQGRGRRRAAPRSSLGTGLSLDRDPVALLDAQNANRLEWPAPLRWQRTAESPFTFYRGAAARMATTWPSPRPRASSCRPAATRTCPTPACALARTCPGVATLNDVDQALPAPGEWDAQRLVASAAVAAQARGHGVDGAREVALAASGAYRLPMTSLAG